MENTWKIIFSVIATGGTWFLGAWDTLLVALATFLVLDYITGFFAALYLGRLSSYVGLKGIIKKVMLIVLVGVAHVFDSITGMTDPYLRTIVIYFILSNEGISILENIAKTGVPIPDMLKKTIGQLKEGDRGK